MARRLVLLRHGESTWNLENLFTGWYDCPLSPRGEAQATTGGQLMAEHGVLPDVLHTSVLTRAIRTAELALAPLDRTWIPVRRHWRLNERHYGDLQGLNKKETAERFGADQVKVWRRAYDVAAARHGPRRRAQRAPRPPLRRPARPRSCPTPSAWPTSSSACCPTGTTPSSPTCSRGAPCWSPRTATACGRWSSTSATSPTTTSSSSTSRRASRWSTTSATTVGPSTTGRSIERYLRSPDEIAAAAEAVARQATG